MTDSSTLISASQSRLHCMHIMTKRGLCAGGSTGHGALCSRKGSRSLTQSEAGPEVKANICTHSVPGIRARPHRLRRAGRPSGGWRRGRRRWRGGRRRRRQGSQAQAHLRGSPAHERGHGGDTRRASAPGAQLLPVWGLCFNMILCAKNGFQAGGHAKLPWYQARFCWGPYFWHITPNKGQNTLSS